MDVLAEPSGCAFLLWLLVRQHHPDTRPEQFLPHLDEQSVDRVLADLLEASGLLDMDPNLVGASGSNTGSPPS